MVKANCFVLIILLTLPQVAESAQFEILPKFCLTGKNDACITTLQISWKTDRISCLINEKTKAVLHCAEQKDGYKVPLQSKETIRFSLIDQVSKKVLATKEFKVLQHQQQALQQRRLSWSVF
jgi:hypothetical protein